MEMTPEMAEILNDLDAATDEGRVKWKLTANRTEVAVAFAESSLVLDVFTSEGDRFALAKFLDSRGEVFESYRCTESDDLPAHLQITELHQKAARVARNVGPRLNSILSQIKGKKGAIGA